MRYITIAIAHWFRERLARYVLVDDCGTVIYAWTLKDATKWLPFCGKEWVQIVDRETNITVVERVGHLFHSDAHQQSANCMKGVY